MKKQRVAIIDDPFYKLGRELLFLFRIAVAITRLYALTSVQCFSTAIVSSNVRKVLRIQIHSVHDHINMNRHIIYHRTIKQLIYIL